jgi:hypothetical protein
VTTGLLYEIIVAREFTSHDPEQRAWFLYCYHPDCQGSRHGPFLNRATARAEAHKHARAHGGDRAHIHDHDDRLPG